MKKLLFLFIAVTGIIMSSCNYKANNVTQGEVTDTTVVDTTVVDTFVVDSCSD